jgi:hypothetical protein
VFIPLSRGNRNRSHIPAGVAQDSAARTHPCRHSRAVGIRRASIAQVVVRGRARKETRVTQRTPVTCESLQPCLYIKPLPACATIEPPRILLTRATLAVVKARTRRRSPPRVERDFQMSIIDAINIVTAKQKS